MGLFYQSFKMLANEIFAEEMVLGDSPG